MKLTFGKHKGKEIQDLPTHYLQWLTHGNLKDGNTFNIPEEIQAEVRTALQQKDAQKMEQAIIKTIKAGTHAHQEILGALEYENHAIETAMETLFQQGKIFEPRLGHWEAL